MNCFITDYSASQPGAVALEDGVMQKGRPVTAGSKMLGCFIAPFDATVVGRLNVNNIPLAGKTAMDEFGIPGLFAEGPEKIPGAVSAVAGGKAGFALCNDLFGTYRRQAPLSGLCYLHPTYGTVSRFGLIPLASSMDQIGIVCKDLNDGGGLLSKIAGYDPGDGAMYPEPGYSYNKRGKNIRVGVPSAVISRADSGAQDCVSDFAKGFASVNIELKYYEMYKQVLYILAAAEISGNLSRYDGIKFGYRAAGYKNLSDLYVKSRAESFGPDVKLAAIMGCMVLSSEYYEPYYSKAMRIRGMIKKSLRFDDYDIIVLPAQDGGGLYEELSLSALPQLCGLPSVSFNYKGRGIQLVANVKCENTLLSAWEEARS